MKDLSFTPFQGTICAPIFLEGIGAHSGQYAHLAIKPAALDTGIVFIRTDLSPKCSMIPARRRYLSNTTLCTALANSDGTQIQTVEHLLAALSLYAIDNAIVEIDAGEVPMLDGSARPYVEALQAVGRRSQQALRRFLRVLRPIRVQQEGRTASLLPSSVGFSLDVCCDYSARSIKRQQYSATLTTENFIKEIAPARTFGFFDDIERLYANGLAQGSSLENAVVFSNGAPLNPEGLRFEDEVVRHKTLDVLGDLALLGYPLCAHFEGKNTGHALNARLTAAVLEHPDCWTITETKPQKSLSLQRSASCSKKLTPAFPPFLGFPVPAYSSCK
ncbi:MAG: UDP-3-O-acyl-N-acetylglucosamine deacetylase [Holosporales bacterium]|jgi:UDP-3-O-[3-hydroxymyristoyl] N-acetylglucosamine deacetylase|nr:UDP-3-O-acyl-N-acetylglucosamine deacetylase [Holosporales bacterium]